MAAAIAASSYHRRMQIRSVSFDDDSNEDLCVFSGDDLQVSHMDLYDLDWEEVAERSILDQRRGLVITQVAVLEDLIDEFILYLVDPPDPANYQRSLDHRTIGPRIDELEQTLSRLNVLDDVGAILLADLRSLVNRRNELTHGTIYRRMVHIVPIRELAERGVDLEWQIFDRRSRTSRRITTSQLREDLHQAIGCFMSLLKWSDRVVQRAPRPRYFRDGVYLATPAAESE
jgi:hypothetical protein